MDQPHDDDCFPVNVYKDESVGVFWNMEDYPVPDGLDPSTIYDNIKDTLESDSFGGEVSILAYVDKNKFSDELRDQYQNVGINTDFIPEGIKHAKFISLLLDVLCWKLKNPAPSNLIILSKDMVEDKIFHLEAMYSYGYNVMLSDTEPGWGLPDGVSDWLISSLTDDGGSSSAGSSPAHEDESDD